VHVADTLGELGLFYRLVEIVFIGGSMAAHGGHNPLEPAQLDCAILHGPDMTNFATVAAQLAQAGATERVADAATLAAAISRLLDDPAARGAAIEAAARVAADNADVVDRVLEALRPFIDALPTGDPDARA